MYSTPWAAHQSPSWQEKFSWYFSGGVQGWICLNCGYIHEGDSAPQVCPLCEHPKGYFIRTDLSPFRG